MTLKYFSPENDPAINWEKADPTSLIMLDNAREIAKTPFRITSSYRTKDQDMKLAGFTGAHTEVPCTAFDIAFTKATGHAILKGLFAAGFIRIGVNFKNMHIHVDNDETRPHPAFFLE